MAGITIVQGKIRVDFTRLKLDGKERLDPCLPHLMDENTIKQILAKDLDAGLANQPPFYFFGLTMEEQKAGKPKKPLDACLLQTSAWADFLKCYNNWVGTPDKAPLLMRSVVWNGLTNSIGALSAIRSRTDFDQAEKTFNVLSFGGKWSDQLPNPLPKDSHVQRKDLVTYLDRFDNGLWRREYIRQVLVDFFARRGWAPTILVPPPGAFPKLAMTISANPPVVQVTFAPPAKSASERERVLYLLFGTRQFNQVRKLPVTQHTGAVVFETIDLTTVTPAAEFNQLAFAVDSPAVASLGFTVTPLNADKGINLQVERNQSADARVSGPAERQGPGNNTGQATGANAATSHAATNRATSARDPVDRACLNEPEGSENACAADPAPRQKNRFLGGGFDYIPGQGVRPLVAFDWKGLGGTNALSMTTGSVNESWFGTGTASFDFIGFGAGPNQLHHRLTLTLNGGTDVVNNRLFGSNPLNERRNGGRGRLEYELHRNPLGHAFFLYADAGDQNVTLTNTKGAGDTVLSENLTSGSFGGIYTLSKLGATRPYRVRLEPKIRAGHAGLGSFYRAVATANYHQESTGRFVLEVNGRFEYASRYTPMYELPTFGGVGIMRGFRTDEFLGRKLWSVQPEVWTPVPGFSDANGKFGQFVSRSVRLAAFYDAGGIYQAFELPVGAKAGVKGGPGAGIRVIYNQATFRLDFAHGMGRAPGGPPAGRFYFSVSSPLF